MPRRFKSFIDGFLAYTDGKGSPAIYRKWTAIFIVGAVLERKAWLRTSKGILYPNQYIVLAGPAGLGKSLCTRFAYDYLDAIRTPETPLHIAPTSVTKASLIDRLADADRRIVRPMDTPPVVSYHALTVVANEFGVFLPAWDGEFMNTLTDLWDCGRYAETRRTRSVNIDLPRTQLNLFSATTSAQLHSILPEGAWEQGFMSRVLIVFSAEHTYTDLFAFSDITDDADPALLSDLRDVYKMYGAFTVAEDAKLAINEWGRAGGPPRPDHPKLMTYSQRRMAHLLKLMMVASAATDDERIITLDNYAEALDWLVELETYMPDVFKAMRSGGAGQVMHECWHYAYKLWMKHKTPVPEPQIIAFLSENVPAHSINAILDAMIRAHLLTKQFLDNGGHGYVPKALKPS